MLIVLEGSAVSVVRAEVFSLMPVSNSVTFLHLSDEDHGLLRRPQYSSNKKRSLAAPFLFAAWLIGPASCNARGAAVRLRRPGASYDRLRTRCSCPRRTRYASHLRTPGCGSPRDPGTSDRERSQWRRPGSRVALLPANAGFPRRGRWTVRPAAAHWRPLSGSTPGANGRAHHRRAPSRKSA